MSNFEFRINVKMIKTRNNHNLGKEKTTFNRVLSLN